MQATLSTEFDMIKYIKMSMLVMILSAAHADEDVDPYVGVYHGAGYNFPASLELNSDNTYSWYFYDKTALQSKGRWHLQDGQIVLNAEKNKNPILLEKLPNNGIPSIHKKIEVCVYPPGSTGSNYGGVNPKRLDISLKNRQKKIISTIYKLETFHNSYNCAAFNLRENSDATAHLSTDNEKKPRLQDIKYVAIREFDTDKWKDYHITEYEKIYSRIAFRSLDINTLPSPFKVTHLSIKDNALIMKFPDEERALDGNYEKVSIKKINQEISGLYSNESGSIRYYPDNTFEWHWKKICCMNEFTVRGRWRKDGDFIMMEEDNQNFYKGGFRFIEKSELSDGKVVMKKLLPPEARSNGLYKLFIGKLEVDGHGLPRFGGNGSWEVKILDGNGKTIISAIQRFASDPIQMLGLKNQSRSSIKIRQLHSNGDWYHLKIPMRMRDDSEIYITPREIVTHKNPGERTVAQIKPDGSITLKSPVVYYRYLNYKQQQDIE